HIGLGMKENLVRRQSRTQVEAAGLVAARQLQVHALLGGEPILEREITAPQMIDGRESMRRLGLTKVAHQIVIVGRAALESQARGPLPSRPQIPVELAEGRRVAR